MIDKKITQFEILDLVTLEPKFPGTTFLTIDAAFDYLDEIGDGSDVEIAPVGKYDYLETAP